MPHAIRVSSFTLLQKAIERERERESDEQTETAVAAATDESAAHASWAGRLNLPEAVG